MELRQLEYLVAIAEEGGFGRAAQRLHVVQSAVSQQVARLERELGVALFHRGGRAARPTPAGEQLLPKARAALAAVAVVTETAAALAAGSGGTLRLGSSRAFTGRVHRALDRLADQAPQVRVEVRQETRRARLEGVRSAALDAALIRGEEPSPGLEFAPLWDDPLLVAVPATHPLAELERLGPADLAGLPVRLAPREHNPAFHDLVLGALRRAGAEPPAGPPFTSLQGTLTALAADAAAGAPSWTVFDAPDPLPQTRRIALRPWDGPPSTAYLVRRAGPGPGTLPALLRALTES
ncbi:LysR family transcriptional regulator [Kitasatospora sp. NBC_01560]|uniref:LysR family transcriptional regulator n=1 Tax=Kitasatospora sp. NBC_01560 TaxID=2975965 RepID=UPI003870C85E